MLVRKLKENIIKCLRRTPKCSKEQIEYLKEKLKEYRSKNDRGWYSGIISALELQIIENSPEYITELKMEVPDTEYIDFHTGEFQLRHYGHYIGVTVDYEIYSINK